MALSKSLRVAVVALPVLGLIILADRAGWPGSAQHGVAVAQLAPAVPPYVRRGDEVEAHYRAYSERLERFYETLSARVAADAPPLAPTVKAAPPKPLRGGYQVLPTLVPDGPAPRERPRAKSAWYTWPWTDRLIDRELEKIDRLEPELDRIRTLAPAERRPAYEKIVAEYPRLREWHQIINSHIQYNRLWQLEIVRNRAGYDRQAALHDAVLERQAVLDALSAPDEAAFRKALTGIHAIDPTKTRDSLDADLREREKTLSHEIYAAIDPTTTPPFLRVEHPAPHRWVVHVSFYTDIEDSGFVQSFKKGIERVWRLRDGDDEFDVELSITYIPATRLYGEQPECSAQGPIACSPPRKGEQIDVHQHIELFPGDGAVLTTGAGMMHVWGRAIALGPHDVGLHVLAHEFGHILGFKDFYFRGYRDLGQDGYQVMEVVADPEDIMGAPGTGSVFRHHFDKILRASAQAGPRAPESVGPEKTGTVERE